MKPEMSKKKQVAGLWYGLAAGLAFAVFAWGVDAFLLASANNSFAWVKFIPGLFICLCSGTLVGWLTVRLQNTLLAILLWIGQALLFAHLIIWLPLKIAPVLIRLFDPALGDYLKYPFYPELKQNLWVGFAIIAAVSIIIAVLENILIDQALFSAGTHAVVVPVIVAMLAFSLVGSTGDSLLNKHLREPVLIVDKLVDFAYENRNNDISSDLARKMHLNALKPVEDLLTDHHRVILSNFDQYLGQVDVLVIFKGHWVKCITIYNQVTNCTPLFEKPWIRLSSRLKLAGILEPRLNVSAE